MGIIVAIAVIVLDQGIKLLIRTNMTEGGSVPVIKNIFHLTYIQNPGAAFGFFAHRTYFFVVASLLVVGLVVYYYRKLPKEKYFLRIALGLLVGGALGNTIDRVRLGKVIDFLDFKVWPYIFNLADAAVVVGSGILILYLLNWDKWGAKQGIFGDRKKREV